MIGVRRLDRLLIALPSTRMGGAERHTALLAARLAGSTGIAVGLAAEPALHGRLAALGLGEAKLLGAPVGWESEEDMTGRAARQAAATRELLDRFAPDAAMVALPWPDAGTGILPALAQVWLPRLVLLHLAPDAPPPDVAPALGLEGAVVAAVSGPVARRAALAWGIAEEAVAVLRNPAPTPSSLSRVAARAALRAALGLPTEAPLLLFVGRLDKAKGADLLPGIAERVAAVIAVAGEGPLRTMLEAAAAEDPRGRLRLLGQLADPAPWYLAADALLMPSRLEGEPLVFLEAAANRCPVVAAPAALEAFGDAASRIAAIAGGGDAAAMADAAAALLDDPARIAALTEAAARLAAPRHWDATAEGALGLLRAAMLRAEGVSG
jgi:glycosyltransferase involved in cell wall biosynthesis